MDKKGWRVMGVSEYAHVWSDTPQLDLLYIQVNPHSLSTSLSYEMGLLLHLI